MNGKTISEFTGILHGCFKDGSLVRMSLSNYRGAEKDLKKITVRPVIIKRASKLSFTYSYKTRDIVKNYEPGDAVQKISQALQHDFGSAVLFTTQFDLSYPAMKKSAPATKEAPPRDHDIAKKRHVNTAGKIYLHDLKITDAQGNIYKNAQDKYRQIDKYIEILGGLIKSGKTYKIADMGAGKGYLTFALYDYLREQGIETAVTGVEYRKDLVDLCNAIAGKSGFDGLHFVEGTVQDYDATGTDILIALHACDTATDDAIAKGIKAGAELIVVAPCCHKQIRRQMEAGRPDKNLNVLLEYGTFMERQAEMVTDVMRGLLLEHAGYSVKIFEFISDSHTPKNVMIVARKTGKKNDKALEKFRAAKAFFGIGEHALEKSLGDNGAVEED